MTAIAYPLDFILSATWSRSFHPQRFLASKFQSCRRIVLPGFQEGKYSSTCKRRSFVVSCETKTSSTAKTKGTGARVLVGFSEGRDEDLNRPVCPGCGVYLQEEDPEAPGYFIKPKVEPQEDSKTEEEVPDIELETIAEETLEKRVSGKQNKDEFSYFVDDVADPYRAAFGPAGPGYGNAEATENGFKQPRRRKNEEAETGSAEKENAEDEPIVCARCYSLRHYGRVKDWKAENLIPDFDFEATVGKRLMKSSRMSSRTVVLMVVDAVDFDGSFPRRAAKVITDAATGWVGGLAVVDNLRVVLVATKVDLLPQQISPARLDQWVRARARAAGSPKLDGVFLVSSLKDLGVRNLAARIKELAGPRGNVWVVGAQNAGKSTLINIIGKKESGKVAHLTEAPVPGTTLGIIRITGILPARARLYDTPGLVHPYQIITRLNREEQKMLEIRKELKPRTYRIKVGQSIHVGALLRLDLIQSSVETIYVTIFASVHLPLHMGKAEKADEIKKKHFGRSLQPPSNEERVSVLGDWKPRKIHVSGKSWHANSLDISVAGLGWLSVGIKGEASLSLWTYDGVDIQVREPLVLDRARVLEKPGFSLTKAAIKAKSLQSKAKLKNEQKRNLFMSKQKSFDELSQEMLEVP
eukprot:TRINITY_DN9968_c0_g1_i1.p1 TRINITY_DN9968_c0_g1~~TRINITY_DN9968_c0_g1_i1.p1  ORF type:complete len:639 (+),score=60.61 TRINITY_DN9968_c0_g1_i1:115-2031(+)